MFSLPINLPGFIVDEIRMGEAVMIIEAHTNGSQATCPSCDTSSANVHSYYVRKPCDLPISEYQVQLLLTVRRFRCPNSSCNKQTFTEPLPHLLPRYARRTYRLERTLYHVGQALSSEAASRLLPLLRMSASGDTLLRTLRNESEDRDQSVQVLGVDDWAFRKGRTYGTILVDLERQRVVGLLPDRTAETLSDWLSAHPEVKIVARDRSTEYAKGISTGAPTASQVADRWHLLQNLSQMLVRQLEQIRGSLSKLPEVKGVFPSGSEPLTRQHIFPRAKQDDIAKEARRQQRQALYQRIRQLRQSGYTIRRIAKRLGITRTTVRKYYYADSLPEKNSYPPVPSILDPYIPYLATRQAEGCENAKQLWREICEVGYPGKYAQVSKWMRQHRKQPATSTAKKYLDSAMRATVNSQRPPSLPSARQLAWLLLSDVKAHSVEDLQTLYRVTQDPTVNTLAQLARQFCSMIRQQVPPELDSWLDACQSTGLKLLESFARGIRQDYAAVRTALETPWSNGQTEGQINRLKLIKRQMYGRANFDLLCIKALYVPP